MQHNGRIVFQGDRADRARFALVNTLQHLEGATILRPLDVRVYHPDTPYPVLFLGTSPDWKRLLFGYKCPVPGRPATLRQAVTLSRATDTGPLLVFNQEDASLKQSLGVILAYNLVPYRSHIALVGHQSRVERWAELDTAVLQGSG